MRSKMDNSLLSLTHEQQQEAVEEIQKLVQQGISMGQAIQIVASQLREQYQQNHLDKKEKFNEKNDDSDLSYAFSYYNGCD